MLTRGAGSVGGVSVCGALGTARAGGTGAVRVATGREGVGDAVGVDEGGVARDRVTAGVVTGRPPAGSLGVATGVTGALGGGETGARGVRRLAVCRGASAGTITTRGSLLAGLAGGALVTTQLTGAKDANSPRVLAIFI
jgi:hypothetical protein